VKSINEILDKDNLYKVLDQNYGNKIYLIILEYEMDENIIEAYEDIKINLFNYEHVNLVYTQSITMAADFIINFCRNESNLEGPITVTESFLNDEDQRIKFLLKIPTVSLLLAIYLAASFNTLQDLINSTPNDLCNQLSNHITLRKAKEICSYFK